MLAVGLVPAASQAQSAIGSLLQLANPNNCIEVTGSESRQCTTQACGISESEDGVLSSDGKDVYVPAAASR